MISMRRTLPILFGFLSLLTTTIAPAQITVVNMVPQARSGESSQDSEPDLTVNPANPLHIAGSAFTWDSLTGTPMIGALAPIYFSTDGGLTWNTALSIPSTPAAFAPTSDITLHFTASPSGTTSNLYASILHSSTGNMRTYRSPNFTVTGVAMTQINNNTNANLDQPHLEAAQTSLRGDPGNDHLFIGYNNGFGGVSPTGRTAAVTSSLNANAAAPAFTITTVEARSTGAGGQDGFDTAPSAHPDGTVYAAFFGWRGTSGIPSDVVVVRDDNWGSGGFNSLLSGGVAGVQVVTNANRPLGTLGQQRLGASNLSLCVDPRSSSRVYMAWGDQPTGSSNETVHVRMSATRGATWSGDLLTITNALNPAIAVNSHGRVGLLYQQLVSNRWQTVLRRSTDAAGLVFDGGTILANTDATTPVAAFSVYIGDYAHMIANGRDFYGIFSASNFPAAGNFLAGTIYNRFVNWGTNQLFANVALTTTVPASIDPFFFHSVELAPSSDLYVRDWTDSATAGDNGAEPSIRAVFYSTSDVWNRRGTLTGEPFISDQPANEDAGNGTGAIGDNWAFARIRRNTSATSESVSAHFVVSPLGTGSNFSDASIAFAGLDMSAPDPPSLTFPVGDAGPKITAPYPWHLGTVSSTHLCLGVQVDSSNDHFITPGLAGHAPGWGSGTDLEVLGDNNKAQRNMGLSVTSARGLGGSVGDFALVHNAATFTRDLDLRYAFPRDLGDKVSVRSIGPYEIRRHDDIITLPKMRPGENRWLEVTLPAAPIKTGDIAAATFDELRNSRVINGFGIGIRGGSNAEVIRQALTKDASVTGRIAALYGSTASKAEEKAARKMLEREVDDRAALAFLRGHLASFARIVRDLEKRGADTAFGAQGRVGIVERAVAAGDAMAAALATTTLMNALDSSITSLELGKGNPADILQTVNWQRELVLSDRLGNDGCAQRLARDSEKFADAFDRGNITVREYPNFLSQQTDCLVATAKLLGADVGPEVEVIKSGSKDLGPLQNAHRNALLKISEAIGRP
jgi:hypothetical protein